MFSFLIRHISDSVASGGFMASRFKGAELPSRAFKSRAVEKPKQYNITFDAASTGGLVYDATREEMVGSTNYMFVAYSDLTLGECISFPSNAVKEGYVFEGWYYPDGQIYITPDTIVSVFTSQANVIAMFSEDSSGGSSESSESSSSSESSESSLCGFLFKPTIHHYDIAVSYMVDEANGNAPIMVDSHFPNGEYTALDYVPTWTGHRFIRWSTSQYVGADLPSDSGSLIRPIDNVAYDITTVYANWQLPTTVTFDATTNGGQMPSGWTAPEYYKGQPFGELPSPVKSGEVFLGWFDTNGARITVDTVVSGSNTTLTARYSVFTYATSYQVTTTSSYKNTGIYSAVRYSSSSPIVIDWGDGSDMEVVYSNLSLVAHTYSSVGTFTVRISDNITTLAMSANNSTWHNTTSTNRYTLKKILSLSSRITQLPSYGFYYCSAMTNVVIPSGATSIPTYCFYYCSALNPFVIPSTVTTIGNFAFYGITGSQFSSMTIPSSVTSLGQYAFGDCYYLHPVLAQGSASLSLGTYAFSRCGYNGSAFTMDLSKRPISTISNYCFYYCRYLKGVIWPSNVKTVGSYAFRYCFYYAASAGTLDIPEGVTTISGNYAFANCTYLSGITLPSTLADLKNYTFYNCTRLSTITVNRTTAPTTAAATFGNATSNYTGRTYYTSGTNKLIVPSKATGYNSSYWSSVLCNSTKCGFTLTEISDSSSSSSSSSDKTTPYLNVTYSDVMNVMAFPAAQQFAIDTNSDGVITVTSLDTSVVTVSDSRGANPETSVEPGNIPGSYMYYRTLTAVGVGSTYISLSISETSTYAGVSTNYPIRVSRNGGQDN